MSKASPVIVYDLRRYLSGGWYLPGAFVAQQDADGKLTHLIQNASPVTIGGYGLEMTPLRSQLFSLIESLSEKALETKYNPPKGKSKPLEILLEQEEVKKLAERFVHRQMDVFLKLMVEHNLPLTFMAEKKALLEDVRIHYPKVELKPHLIFRKMKDKVIYRLNFSTGDERWLVRWKRDLVVLTNIPGWLLVDGALYALPELNGNMVKPFYQKDEVAVPNHLVRTYFEKVIMKAVEKTEIEAEGFDLTGTRKLEGCELSLTKHLFHNAWYVTVRFQYLGASFQQNDRRDMRTALHFQSDADIRIMQVKRNAEAEQHFLQKLENQGFTPAESGLWRLPGSVGEQGETPFLAAAEWLAEHRSDLESVGFSLESPVFEDQKIALLPASWSQEVEARGDWFDLRITIRVGNFEFSFTRLIPHIRDNDRFFPLADGSFFIIPSEWMSRFHALAHLGKPEGDRLFLAKSQRPLLETSGLQATTQPVEKEAIAFEKPPLLEATLRPYQEAGARWLMQHYHDGLGACLADDMGLGKTLQTLAVLLHAKKRSEERGVISEERGEGRGVRSEGTSPLTSHSSHLTSSLLFPEDFPALQALIILPASLVFNWEKEVKKFASLVQVCKHVGAQRTKDDRLLRRYDLVLTTYQTAQKDLAILKKIEWTYIVLDESQYIKNPQSQAFKAVGELAAGHKISLSGTPIENSLSDLWAQMQFLNPGMLGNFPYFKKHFIQPIEKQGDESKKEELRRLVSPYLLRRTKEEVAPDLPELTETVFYSEMTEAQRKLYEREKSAVRNQLLGLGDLSKQRIQVLAALTRLRQLANHAALISDLGFGMADLESTAENPNPKSEIESGKFADVLEYWRTVQRAGHKALIFSSFEQHLQLFRAHFEEEKIPFAWLTGDVSEAQRKAEVDRFQNDPLVQVFFITLKAGGVGLNLTAADYVFLLDPWWNPATENQAIARAHRIGQTKNVMAVRFIAKDSIEEKIQQLQERKSKLASEFFTAPEQVAATREGLEALLG